MTEMFDDKDDPCQPYLDSLLEKIKLLREDKEKLKKENASLKCNINKLDEYFHKKLYENERLMWKEVVALKECAELKAENVRLKHENYELKEIKFNREAALELQGIELDKKVKECAELKEEINESRRSRQCYSYDQ